MNGLAGRHVVVTRAAHQAEELAGPLRDVGASVLLLPLIEIAPPADPALLRRAALDIDQYDWIVFSSTNAVAAVAGFLPSRQKPPRGRIAVVGSATEQAIKRLGWHADVVPQEFVAESLVEALSPVNLRGRRLLLPSAAVTRDVIPRALRECGALVDVVEAYRNIIPGDAASRARNLFAKLPYPDWLTFTSPSCVENLVSILGTNPVATGKPDLLADVSSMIYIASIGPVTSGALRRYGFPVHAEPEEHTIPGLVRAMQDFSAV